MYLTNDLFKTAAYYQEDKSMVNYRKLDSQDRTWLQKIVEDFRNQHISEEKARAFLDDTHICVYMAYEDQQVCGYVLAYLLPRMDLGNDMMLIYHCFVKEEYRHRHIAQTLMDLTIKDAESLNIHYTFLITQDTNDAANALYTKLNGELHPHNKNVNYWYGSGRPME